MIEESLGHDGLPIDQSEWNNEHDGRWLFAQMPRKTPILEKELDPQWLRDNAGPERNFLFVMLAETEKLYSLPNADALRMRHLRTERTDLAQK